MVPMKNKPPSKLGVIVEGEDDRVVLGALIPRIAPKVHAHFVRMGGRTAMVGAGVAAADLLDRGYDAVLVVADADTDLPEGVARHQKAIESALRAVGVDRRTSVVLAVPQLEAWLLTAHTDKPEREPDPKRALKRWAKGRTLVDQATTLDLTKAERRSPSFKRLVAELRKLPT